jgi:hypothetical protein
MKLAPFPHLPILLVKSIIFKNASLYTLKFEFDQSFFFYINKLPLCFNKHQDATPSSLEKKFLHFSWHIFIYVY